MMKKYILIVFYTITTCVLNAAETQLKNASNYIFSAPIMTNNIQGLVMGPDGDYAQVRSEDLAWFAEAFYERLHLIDTVAYTNLFADYSSFDQPKIATSRPSDGFRGALQVLINTFKDQETKLIEAPRIIPLYDHKIITNVTTKLVPTYNLESNIVIHSQQLLDGRTDVLTNITIKPVVKMERINITNCYDYAQHVNRIAVDEFFPGIVNTNEVVQEFHKVPNAYKSKWITKSAITNAFKLFNTMTRIADFFGDHNNSFRYAVDNYSAISNKHTRKDEVFFLPRYDNNLLYTFQKRTEKSRSYYYERSPINIWVRKAYPDNQESHTSDYNIYYQLEPGPDFKFYYDTKMRVKDYPNGPGSAKMFIYISIDSASDIEWFEDEKITRVNKSYIAMYIPVKDTSIIRYQDRYFLEALIPSNLLDDIIQNIGLSSNDPTVNNYPSEADCDPPDEMDCEDGDEFKTSMELYYTRFREVYLNAHLVGCIVVFDANFHTIIKSKESK